MTKKKNIAAFACFSVLLLTLSNSEISRAQTESTTSDTKTSNPKVIYGIDNRREIYQLKSEFWRQRALSTVALIKKERMRSVGQMFQIKTENYGSLYNLCNTEPFREQGTAAYCSGFFIGEDLFVTAGHCIRDIADCSEANLVFDFALSGKGDDPREVHQSKVFRCTEIIKSELNPRGADYSIIRVDRPVKGRMPLKLRQAGSPSVGDTLIAIGHPTGLPTKIAGGGLIRDVTPVILVAGVDTYGGNSGSAIFSRKTGNVEGILVRGENDYVANGSCLKSKVCPMTGCRGEDITRISHVLKALEELP